VRFFNLGKIKVAKTENHEEYKSDKCKGDPTFHHSKKNGRMDI
jgi:hypothetical protein